MITDVDARSHLASLSRALEDLEDELDRLRQWGDLLARVLLGGGRLLVGGNGGSAAEAQHLTAELVGRFERERPPLSALALHAETSSLTAIGNDFGAEEAFARQVRAHGRPGDVALLLSTSGESANVLNAAEAAIESGLVAWALTGPAPNPLAELCDDALTVDADRASTIQEAHLVAVHLLCGYLEAEVERSS